MSQPPSSGPPKLHISGLDDDPDSITQRPRTPPNRLLWTFPHPPNQPDHDTAVGHSFHMLTAQYHQTRQPTDSAPPPSGSPSQPSLGQSAQNRRAGGFLSTTRGLRKKTSRIFSSSKGKQRAPSPAPTPSDPSPMRHEPADHCLASCSCRKEIETLHQENMDLRWKLTGTSAIHLPTHRSDEQGAPHHCPNSCSCREGIERLFMYLEKTIDKVNQHEDRLHNIEQWVEVSGPEPEPGDGGRRSGGDDAGGSGKRRLERESTWTTFHSTFMGMDLSYLKFE